MDQKQRGTGNLPRKQKHAASIRKKAETSRPESPEASEGPEPEQIINASKIENFEEQKEPRELQGQNGRKNGREALDDD